MSEPTRRIAEAAVLPRSNVSTLDVDRSRPRRSMAVQAGPVLRAARPHRQPLDGEITPGRGGHRPWQERQTRCARYERTRPVVERDGYVCGQLRHPVTPAHRQLATRLLVRPPLTPSTGGYTLAVSAAHCSFRRGRPAGFRAGGSPATEQQQWTSPAPRADGLPASAEKAGGR